MSSWLIQELIGACCCLVLLHQRYRTMRDEVGAPCLVANGMVCSVENQRIQTTHAWGRHEEARSHARGSLVFETRRRLSRRSNLY